MAAEGGSRPGWQLFPCSLPAAPQRPSWRPLELPACGPLFGQELRKEEGRWRELVREDGGLATLFPHPPNRQSAA